MTKHFCDCCNEMLDNDKWMRIEYKLTSVDPKSDFVQESSKRHSDLCSECFKNVMKILNGGNVE